MQHKMLVVDDDVDVVIVVVAAAKARGFGAIGTTDPTEVPMRVRVYRPDIVLLDLQMGKHDGRDLLAQLKRDTETAVSIVVVMSGTYDPHTRALCRDYGAADFVTKPFILDDLFHRVDVALRRAGGETRDGDNG